MWDGWSLQRTGSIVKVHKVIEDKKGCVFESFYEGLKSYGELYVKSFLGELGFIVNVSMNWCKMMI